jgi:hypothetical protein
LKNFLSSSQFRFSFVLCFIGKLLVKKGRGGFLDVKEKASNTDYDVFSCFDNCDGFREMEFTSVGPFSSLPFDASVWT